MIAYLNGQFLPLAEARISPLDRGFLYADGVYEVIPVYSRTPFRIDEHLRRLQSSLDGIRLPNPHANDEWRAIILRLIAETEFEDQTLYIQVTRGADIKRDPTFPKGIAQTVFLFAAPLIRPTPEQRENGVATITAQDIRWGRCDLKTVALLPNVLMRQLGADAGCTETIMLRDGFLTEGSASNIFVVKDGIILAPPKDHRMLPGITYDMVLELATRHGAPHEIRPISEAELRSADELWITSSTKEVLPISTLDGQPVGQGALAGKPGPVTRQMQSWYRDFREQVTRGAGA
jgi:D-alanine transaminase